MLIEYSRDFVLIRWERGILCDTSISMIKAILKKPLENSS